VNGAVDPISGRSRKGLKRPRAVRIAKEGWKHSRTLIYCLGWRGASLAWLDEWQSFMPMTVKQQCGSYFNSDGNGPVSFAQKGSHSLETLVNGVVKDVDDPDTNMSVWKSGRLAGS